MRKSLQVAAIGIIAVGYVVVVIVARISTEAVFIGRGSDRKRQLRAQFVILDKDEKLFACEGRHCHLEFTGRLLLSACHFFKLTA